MPANIFAIRSTRFGASALLFLVATTAIAQSPSRLQSLVNDTAAQLQIAYRHNAPERRARYEQLSRAVAAWKAAPRSEENDRMLTDWLRTAIRRSMPGSREPLPPSPAFKRPFAETTPTSSAADKSTGDPFADDPFEIEQ
jgi:hypothetical protein